ncbi:unnamed protein product [Hymenolepis diminuta]|uniref:Uncharacterized protein n=1 Tax=Hymenolepis diminuta TaxID=6216 RepID=A0A3P6ZNK5_HYMDI|nr:unnamed protein product [Hymenolepis diminuta]
MNWFFYLPTLVKDKYGDLNGSRTVADERICNIKKPNTGVNKSPPKENVPWKEIVENGFPIVGSTEPYAFLLDSSGEVQNSDDFVDNIQLTESCEDSPEDCADRLGSSTAVIGIGTMCSIFFIAVIVSAFFIRRKILRRQRRIFRVQHPDVS